MGKKSKRKQLEKTSTVHSSSSVNSKEIKDLDLDHVNDGLYSGTFRWTKNKVFQPLSTSLPPTFSLDVALNQSWETFLTSRQGSSENTNTSLTRIATQDAAFLDALSFPVTVASVIHSLNLCPIDKQKPNQDFHLIILGATIKAEQRIYHNSNYWQELRRYFPKIRTFHLWFTGPEIRECPENLEEEKDPSFQVHFVQGTAGDVLTQQQNPSFHPSNTLCIGYNPGFGNFIESGRHELLWSWLPDLRALALANIPTAFTCANDYADMNGEFSIHLNVVGSNFRLLPRQNPFSAASHLHAPGQRETSWSRANSFMYVVQGLDPTRAVVDINPIVNNQKLLHEHLDKDVLNNLVLEDVLGRRLIRGTIISKAQAAQYDHLMLLKERQNQEAEREEPQQQQNEAPRWPQKEFHIEEKIVWGSNVVLIGISPDERHCQVKCDVPDVRDEAEIEAKVGPDSVVVITTLQGRPLEIALPFQVQRTSYTTHFEDSVFILEFSRACPTSESQI